MVKRGVSTLQEKQYLPKQQIMPSAKCCKQNHMNTRLFGLSFCSIPVFFLDPFTSLRERKLSLLITGKIQRFVVPGRSKMISLQDSPFTDGILAYSSPAFSFTFFLSLSLSPLSSFYVCRHIQRAIHKLKFIAFFKMNVCFCKK